MSGELSAGVPRVHDPCGFDQHRVYEASGNRTVLDSSRNDQHLTLSEVNCSAAKLNLELTIQHKEELVRFGV